MPKTPTKHAGVRKISLKRGEVIFEEVEGNTKAGRKSNAVNNGKYVKLSDFNYYIKHDKRGKLLPLLEDLISKNHRYQTYLKERNDTIAELRGHFKKALEKKLERREEVVERRTKKKMKRQYHERIGNLKQRLEIEANDKLFQTGYSGKDMLVGIERTLLIMASVRELFGSVRERRFAHALSIYNIYEFLYHEEANKRWKITNYSINFLAKEEYIYIYNKTEAKHGYGAITPKGVAFLNMLNERLINVIKSIENGQDSVSRLGRRKPAKISVRVRRAAKRRSKIATGAKPSRIRLGKRHSDKERRESGGVDIPERGQGRQIIRPTDEDVREGGAYKRDGADN